MEIQLSRSAFDAESYSVLSPRQNIWKLIIPVEDGHGNCFGNKLREELRCFSAKFASRHGRAVQVISAVSRRKNELVEIERVEPKSQYQLQ